VTDEELTAWKAEIDMARQWEDLWRIACEWCQQGGQDHPTLKEYFSQRCLTLAKEKIP
jgi:hypothetical protein